MPTDRLRAYLDADVMLSYIDGDEDRAPEIEELLRRAASGQLDVLTSVLSHVEVAYAASEKAGSALDANVEANIDALWVPPSPITTVEFYAGLALQARTLIRAAVVDGRSLRSHDAIHLATAIRWDCTDFFTYDQRLLKLPSALTGLRIAEPMNPQRRLDL